ncbi:MAG: threonine--tRNA ligase, partial [Thermoproteota archaeon]|nr:threonine--tRNA ligase [Thermoproteota archaeon]
MRLIQLHSDFIEYTPVKKEIEKAEENISNDKVRLEDLVVVLTAVEEGDNEDVINQAVQEIQKYLKSVKSDKLLIYPYAHLSSKLAGPVEAYDLLKQFEDAARKSFTNVYRAPFGWTKAFNIQVKGHPLAENAKEINTSSIASNKSNQLAEATAAQAQTNQGETQMSSALKAEEKLESSWYILEPGGQVKESRLIPISEYHFKKHQNNLRTLTNYEIQKRRA